MMSSENLSKAVELFDGQQYREAFSAFVESYNQCSSAEQGQEIFQILEEAYYTPNVDELQKNYEENSTLLDDYPFQIGFQKYPFEELSVQLFPVTEREYCLFDKNRRCFSELRMIESEEPVDYIFSNLDRPVFRENDCNLYHLKFLRDNVRRSEDYGADNHIYLYYSEWSQLLPLLLLGELQSLLKEQKFVFLIGPESRSSYPIDFKKQFQIDYSKMGPQKLRIEEMQRICFWYKRGYTGSSLGVEVLACNPYIVGMEGVDLFYHSSIQGHPFFQTNLPEKILKDTSAIYTIQNIEALYHHPNLKWGVQDMGDFIRWLKSSRLRRFTIPELFRAYFIYKYHRDKPDMNPRIVPVILWEPHLNAVDIHNPLVLSFPYKIVLNIFRDPVQTVGRIYQREGSIFIPQILWIGRSMNPELKKHYYSFRFEDLKLHPVETCKALCELFNVPYDSNMLTADAAEKGINGEATVHGFDLAPLHRNIDSAFSAFDQVRLQIFYDSILRHYGYPAFDFDECPMNDQDVAFLMKFPFKCERDYVERGKWEKTTPELFRQRLFQNMMATWQAAKSGQLVFPKVIFPKLEETCKGT